MLKLPKMLLAAAAGAYLLGLAIPAGAGNHIACYKGKDPAAKGKFSGISILSNTGLPSISGCTVQVPAKLCCDAVDKIGHTGPGPINNSNKFCCYKVKCLPKPAPTSLPIKDQFGTRTFPTKSLAYLCAPASPSGAFLDDSSAF